MAEEVDIGNVGGKGVASEETLAALVKAVEHMAKRTGFDPKAEAAKVQKLHNAAVKAGTKATKDSVETFDVLNDEVKEATARISAMGRGFNILIAGLSGIAGSITNFGKELLNGGNNLQSFAQHVPIIGDEMKFLASIIDDTVDSFRSVSQVGATFSGELEDLRKTAGAAGIPLTDFTNLIVNNSEKLKAFGTNTTAAAKNFAAISSELRSNFGTELMNLGYTSMELNETLLEYAETQARIYGADRAQRRITAQGTADYAIQLQKLSVLTGKRRDQIAQELNQTLSDSRSRTAIAAIDSSDRDRFVANLMQSGQLLKTAIVDMADGLPNNEMTQGLWGLSKTFRNEAANVKKMSDLQFNNFKARVRNDVNIFETANKDQLQGLMNSNSKVAAVIDVASELYNERLLTDEQFNRQQDEMRKAQGRDNSILTFAETVNRIRGDLQVAFIDSGIFGLIEDGFESLADFFTSDDGVELMKTSVNKLASFFKSFISDMKSQGFWATITNYLKDIFLGKEVDVDPRDLESSIQRQGGVLGAMTDGIKKLFSDNGIIQSVKDGTRSLLSGFSTEFSNFWNSSESQEMRNTIKNLFEDLINSMHRAFINNSFYRLLTGASREDVALSDLSRPGSADSNAAQNFGEIVGSQLSQFANITGEEQQRVASSIAEILPTLSEDQQKLFQEIKDNSSIIPNNQAAINALTRKAASDRGTQEQRDLLKSIYGELRDRGLLQTDLERTTAQTQNMINRVTSSLSGNNEFWGNEDKGQQWARDQITELNSKIESLGGTVLDVPGFSQGTTGFENFGTGKLAMLHGMEAVIPIDSPLGTMISDFNSSKTQSFNLKPTSIEKGNSDAQLLVSDIDIGPLTNTIDNLKDMLTETMKTSNQELGESIKELNTLMSRMLMILTQQKEIDSKIERNTASLGSDLSRGRVTNIR